MQTHYLAVDYVLFSYLATNRDVRENSIFDPYSCPNILTVGIILVEFYLPSLGAVLISYGASKIVGEILLDNYSVRMSSATAIDRINM